jgi:hypothetical protein
MDSRRFSFTEPAAGRKNNVSLFSVFLRRLLAKGGIGDFTCAGLLKARKDKKCTKEIHGPFWPSPC